MEKTIFLYKDLVVTVGLSYGQRREYTASIKTLGNPTEENSHLLNWWGNLYQYTALTNAVDFSLRTNDRDFCKMVYESFKKLLKEHFPYFVEYKTIQGSSLQIPFLALYDWNFINQYLKVDDSVYREIVEPCLFKETWIDIDTLYLLSKILSANQKDIVLNIMREYQVELKVKSKNPTPINRSKSIAYLLKLIDESEIEKQFLENYLP